MNTDPTTRRGAHVTDRPPVGHDAGASRPTAVGHRLPPWQVVAYYTVFCVSGFAALLYQTIWQRVLAIFSGADVYSVTIVVSAFMGGLGLGNLAGGHLADRLSIRGRFLAFSAAELAIGLFALPSLWLYHEVLYARIGALSLGPIAMAVVLFLTLLWPTFFMGMSLPLLARALTGSTAQAASRVAGLYAWNTIGAAFGSLVTVWVLARTLGFRSTVQLGAALNISCAVVAMVLARFTTADSPPRQGTTGADALPAPPVAFGLGAWLGIYALSGYVALSLEILWFRLLGTILKSNAFTFGTLLAFYLVGVGLGAFVARSWARRSSRPATTFLALQTAIAIYASVSLGLFLYAAPRVPWLQVLWGYMSGYDPLDVSAALRQALPSIVGGGAGAGGSREAALGAILYGLLPLYLIGPPTLLMGMSFPFLQRCAQTHLAALGRRVGWLQTANIVGCLIGAAFTGLFLLTWLASAGTLRALVGVSAVFLALYALSHPRGLRRPGVAVGVLLLAVAFAGAPSNDALWARLHGARPGAVVVGEDGSGLSVLKQEASGRVTVYVNGLGQSQIPYGGIHSALGSLPVMLHPAPVEVLAIGLGSGDTVFAMGGREETRVMHAVEIVAPQLRTLETLDRRHPFPGLRRLLADPRVRHTFGDGRAFLMRGGRYDVIEADALRPQSAYAGNLYSVEYFALMRRSLKPGGFGVSWRPTRRTEDTFVKVFPHVLAFRDILVGSNEPIVYDRAEVLSRLRAPFAADYYLRGGVAIESMVAGYLAQAPTVYGPGHDRTGLRDVNTDLFPRDEFQLTDPLPARPPSPAPQ